MKKSSKFFRENINKKKQYTILILPPQSDVVTLFNYVFRMTIGNMGEKRLYVGNLFPEVTEDELRTRFNK